MLGADVPAVVSLVGVVLAVSVVDSIRNDVSDVISFAKVRAIVPGTDVPVTIDDPDLTPEVVVVMVIDVVAVSVVVEVVVVQWRIQDFQPLGKPSANAFQSLGIYGQTSLPLG